VRADTGDDATILKHIFDSPSKTAQSARLNHMRQVLLLRVEFKYELEDSNRAIGQIVRAFERHMWKGMHGKRTIGFVIATEETAADLIRRLRPTLESVEGIDNYWCHVAPPAVVARHGFMDPLASNVAKEWEYVLERLQAKHMRYS
jgi:hypothetical protein